MSGGAHLDVIRPRLRVGALLTALACTASCVADSAGEGAPALPTIVTTAPSSLAPPASSEVPTTAATTLPPVPARTPPWIGATLPGGVASRIHAWEERLGTRFDLIRRFTRWDDPGATEGFDELLDTGHWIHLSIRPVTVNGRVIAWRDLAEAQPGDPVYGQFVTWVDRLVELGPRVLVTLNHEPETTDSAANGDAADFVAAWRRFAELVRARGGDELGLVWTMTGGSFSDDRAERWYPGDDVVDVVGADLYNWHTCQGTDRPWRSMAELIEDPLAFARAHGKPLAIPEFGSVEDAAVAGRKAEWIDGAAATFTSPEVAGDLVYAAWFDITAPGGQWPDCVWDHDTSDSSAAAFAAMVEIVAEH